jgi:hypothetical protein
MEDKEVRFVNLGVYPETRARLNVYKANAEYERLESVTVDEVINELLDMAAKQKPAPVEDLLETIQHGKYA